MVKKKNVRNAASEGLKKALDTGFLLSIGIASIAKENLEKVSKDLVKKGRLNEKQGRKVVNDLLKKSKKERATIRKILRR
jgi:polyhydroxyalkanoate synthesis regulator phasin